MGFTKKSIKIVFAVAGIFLSALVQASPTDIQHWTTDNGARVYFVRAPQLPIVDLRVVFNAGSARDGDKPGLATFTNHMMTMGADGLNATAIAKRFEGLGARFSNGSERDMAWLELRSLSEEKKLTPALETLAKIMVKPDFPEKDFAREKQRSLIGLQRQKQSPGTIAQQAFYKTLYGDHPYAHLPSGTEEGVKSITVKDLRSFHQRYYASSNAVISIVGDLERTEAEQIAKLLVAKMQKGTPAPPLPKVQELKKGKTVRIHHPSSQTHILIGQPGMYRGDPDYFALYVGNHALGGGGLVSRLSEEVREKRGLSYSVYSYFLPMARKGPFMMGSQTQNEQTQQAVQVMMETMKKYLSGGMTAKELEASTKNITGGFPLRIDSNKKIMEYIAMIGFYGLPLDYLDKFNQRIEELSLEQINKAMSRRLDPEQMITVVVGGEQ